MLNNECYQIELTIQTIGLVCAFVHYNRWEVCVGHWLGINTMTSPHQRGTSRTVWPPLLQSLLLDHAIYPQQWLQTRVTPSTNTESTQRVSALLSTALCFRLAWIYDSVQEWANVSPICFAPVLQELYHWICYWFPQTEQNDCKEQNYWNNNLTVRMVHLNAKWASLDVHARNYMWRNKQMFTNAMSHFQKQFFSYIYVGSPSVSQTCHDVVERESYLRQCLSEVCSCTSHTQCQCTVLTAYAHHCAQEGVLMSWRNHTFCRKSLHHHIRFGILTEYECWVQSSDQNGSKWSIINCNRIK